MKYNHNPALPWRNPENAPLDKIPEGWRLMLPGEVGYPEHPCRLWMNNKVQDGFSHRENVSIDGDDGYTYVIPSSIPLPEWIQGMTPEAKPVVTVDNSELRDSMALAVIPSIYKSLHWDCNHGQAWPENWQLGISMEAYSIADAMLQAREVIAK